VFDRAGCIPAICFALAALGQTLPARAQTTEGLIAGTVVDGDTGQPLANAVVEYFRRENEAVAETGTRRTNGQGAYAFALLSPGSYQIRVCSAPCELPGDYQPQEIYGLELPVAGRLEVTFALRKLSDVWKAGIAEGMYRNSVTAIIHYYASDVSQLRSAYIQLVPYRKGSLGASLSYVVDRASVEGLPLAGRDVYTALVLQPGVTSDSATARGLGLTVNGQRPTASNYLLDGVESNNSLVTGPLTALAPEMIQEYRISTSSWSAEYGGTAGFIANARTRSAGAAWHGTAYFNLENDALNANTFQNNAHVLPRSPLKEAQSGFDAGGPLWKRKLFFSAGLEVYRARFYQPPETLDVPSPLAIKQGVDPAGAAHALLTGFPTPATEPGNGTITVISVRPTVSLDRYFGLVRADYVSGSRRLMLRVALNRFDRPDFVWDPYPQFTSGLTQPVSDVALRWIQAFLTHLSHELHAGWSRDTVRWDRPHPEIPTVDVSPPSGGPPLVLPGSPLLYGFRNMNRKYQVNDAWSWLRSRHIVRFGGGLVYRQLNTIMTTGKDGEVTFPSMNFFLFDMPLGYSAAVDRLSTRLQLPAFGRTYKARDFSFFAEDTWRLGRLVWNAGLRYENFGAPVNNGAVKDTLVRLGAGANFAQRIAAATLETGGAGDQKLWPHGNRDFSPRVGFAWDLGGRAPVVRGAYGIFFDRIFDNLWESIAANSLILPVPFTCAGFQCRNYLSGPNNLLPLFQNQNFSKGFPYLTLMEPSLRDGYTQSYFLGLEKRISDSWGTALNMVGSLGRRLLDTDVVNRPFLPYNTALQDEIHWRSSQGSSNYNALTAVARHRSRYGMLQISYTWSHSIDDQSDPLSGEFFDLYFTNVFATASSSTKAAFTREFNSHADRATSDFDQRHNLLFYSRWDVPAARRGGALAALLRGWQFSQMAAFRTGFPYTVRSAATAGLLNQRADIVDTLRIMAPAGAPADAGAVALLNPAAFQAPPDGVVGNSGRNAFRGPGLWNLDLSLRRSFALPFPGDSGRLRLHADFYNAFNHANLNNPNSLYGSPGFGQASYGRLDYSSGFPGLTPLNETPRQVQLTIKLDF
jgi:hypothetical protein